MLSDRRYRYHALLYGSMALLSLVLHVLVHGSVSEAFSSAAAVLFLAALHIFAALYFISIRGEKYVIANAPTMARVLRKRDKNVADGEYRNGLFIHEVLFAISLVVFLFSYIFALAANMDYVQRFIALGGNLNLAIDTQSERIRVLLQYGLYLLLYPAISLQRKRSQPSSGRALNKKPIQNSFVHVTLIIVSALLHALSFPSFLSSQGIGVLAWIALLPLFLVLRKSRFPQFLFYAVFWFSISMLIRNYWLGTFSLVSLQVALVILLVYALIFFLFLWLCELFLRYFERKYPRRLFLHILLFVLVYSSAWTIFDWVQTQGFTAYPWTLMPHSQWRNLALMQISSVSGIWGIGQLIYLVNGVLASFFFFPSAYNRSWKIVATTVLVLIISIHGIAALVLLNNPLSGVNTHGYVELADNGELIAHHDPDNSRAQKDNSVRIALVQQNSDPHKHDYEATLDTLITLSEGVRKLVSDVDLFVWSETAFVPNIARWGGADQDPDRPLVRVVRRMLDFQKTLDAWLLTGNDDYQILQSDGKEERKSYNAAILFSPEGERVNTYHKIRLVPFTEYFPYKEELPGIYALLENFDVHFWEPGSERTVFQHPNITFSTPICFEDSFPDEVRKFVLAGAEVILNISNDYWSLSEVAAKQHFAASLFRAVENRRYLLRGTASGMTAVVDPYGRIILELPSYIPAVAAVDIPQSQSLDRSPHTPYTQFGDIYIILPCSILLLCFLWLCWRR